MVILGYRYVKKICYHRNHIISVAEGSIISMLKKSMEAFLHCNIKSVKMRLCGTRKYTIGIYRMILFVTVNTERNINSLWRAFS